jgi:hypothetical protein
MALSEYVSSESMEKVALAFVEEMLFPALDKVVADSSNPYDDMGLAAAKPMILAAVSKIHDEAAAE